VKNWEPISYPDSGLTYTLLILVHVAAALRLTQAFFNYLETGQKFLSSLFNQNAGQIKIEVILTEFNSINNTDVGQPH